MQAQGIWSAGPGDDKQRFLADLRALRDTAALGYDELAARTHYPDDILKDAESGPALPGLPVLAAYVRACDGDVPEWEERWRRLGFGADADPGLPARPAGASPAAEAGARASVGVAPPDAYDPDRIRAVLRGIHQPEQDARPAALSNAPTTVAPRTQEFGGSWSAGASQDAGWGETAAPGRPEIAEDTVRLRAGFQTRFPSDDQAVFQTEDRAGYQVDEPVRYQPGEPVGYGVAEPAGYRGEEPAGYRAEDPAGYRVDEPAGYRAEDPVGYRADEPAGYQHGPAGYQPGERLGYEPTEQTGFQRGADDPSGGDPYRDGTAGMPAVGTPDEVRAEAIRRDPFSADWLHDSTLAPGEGTEYSWHDQPGATSAAADSWFARPGAGPREPVAEAATESWFAPRDLADAGPESHVVPGDRAGPGVTPSFVPAERVDADYRPPAEGYPAEGYTVPRVPWPGPTDIGPAETVATDPAGPAERAEPASRLGAAQTPAATGAGSSVPSGAVNERRSDRVSLVRLLLVIVVAAVIGSVLVLLLH